MNSMLSHSTHFPETCNFNTDGLVTTDYLRAKTTDLNILQIYSGPCAKMEYINIRGYDCYDCTVVIAQNIKSASNGSVESGGGEDNFGYYNTINPSHRCTSGDNATTQWWFGEQ